MCSDPVCKKTTGACEGGCRPGYTGDYCNEGVCCNQSRLQSLYISTYSSINLKKPLIKYFNFPAKPKYTKRHHWWMNVNLKALRNAPDWTVAYTFI